SSANLVITDGAPGLPQSLIYAPLFDASPRDRNPATDLVGLDQLTQAWEAVNGAGTPLAIAYGGNSSLLAKSIASVKTFNTALNRGPVPGPRARVAKYGRSKITATIGIRGTVTAPAEVITYFMRSYFLPALAQDLPAYILRNDLDTGVPPSGTA